MCSPSQVLRDVYTEVLEAAHPLHRGPTDHKRSVGPLLSLPEVHNQLFHFSGLIIVGNEAQSHSIISKCDNRRE